MNSQRCQAAALCLAMLRGEDTRKPLERTLKFSGLPESVKPAVEEAFIRAGKQKDLANLFKKQGLAGSDLEEEAKDVSEVAAREPPKADKTRGKRPRKSSV